MQQRRRLPGAGGGLLGELRQHQRHVAVRHAGQRLAAARGGSGVGLGCGRLGHHSNPWPNRNAQLSHQRRMLAGRRDLRVHDHVVQVRVGDEQEPLEGCQRLKRHGGQPRLGEAADQPVHLLVAAMRGTKSRAPPAVFHVVGHSMVSVDVRIALLDGRTPRRQPRVLGTVI